MLHHKHLIDIDEYSVRGDRRDSRTRRRSFKEVNDRAIKKLPTLRGRTVINLFLEPSTRTRTSFEIAGKRHVRRRHQLLRLVELHEKGRDACRHGRDAQRHERRPHRRAQQARGRAAPARPPCRCPHRQRRRRQAPAPHPGAARRVHNSRALRTARGAAHRHRRRHRALARCRLARAVARQDGRQAHRHRAGPRSCPRSSGGGVASGPTRSTTSCPSSTSSTCCASRWNASTARRCRPCASTRCSTVSMPRGLRP